MKNISIKDYAFVAIQILVMAAFFLVPEIQFNSGFMKIPGLLAGIMGLFICVWSAWTLRQHITAFPTPKKDSLLIQKGPYAFSRHPIYSGITLCGFGISIFTQDLSKLFITLLLYILFYFKSQYEEKLLKQKFGTQYEAYQKNVGRFFTL